jgi:hypothetical protein
MLDLAQNALRVKNRIIWLSNALAFRGISSQAIAFCLFIVRKEMKAGFAPESAPQNGRKTDERILYKAPFLLIKGWLVAARNLLAQVTSAT